MPKARARKAPAEIEEPSKAWLDSYADAVTLLLAFFILLYALSSLDEAKFLDFQIGVADAIGLPSPVIDGGGGILDTGNGVASLVSAKPAPSIDASQSENPTDADTSVEEFLESNSEATAENAEELVEALEERIAQVGASDLVEVVNDPRGVILRFDSQVLFRSGDAKILPDGVLVMQSVAEALRSLDNLLVVEGHTDNVPTDGTLWPTNWELSVNRATNVLRYLTDIERVPPVRISAAGFADTRPRVSNDTPAGRAENRRVEIVIVIAPFAERVIDPDAEPSAGGSADLPSDERIDDPVGVGTDPALILDLDPAPVEPAE